MSLLLLLNGQPLVTGSSAGIRPQRGYATSQPEKGKAIRGPQKGRAVARPERGRPA